MKIIHEFKLVKGTFEPEEAKEVLYKLINSKIKFHQLQAFSHSERNDDSILQTNHRIEDLQKIRENLNSVLLQAEKENKKIKIDGTISIEFLDA